jgi:rare lipoprotein A
VIDARRQGERRGAQRTARSLRALGAALLVLALQTGCSASRAPAEGDAARASTVVVPRSGPNGINPPRSARGNPPFYDVLGKRYYVRATSDGYRERGVASWYGRDFHGLATSSGEIYDMNELTAAHTTLPIPTWVEVTNLENDRHVIVKVNDRGPFVGNRIIDLSYAAARSLDMVRNGTARVEVRALGSPAADPQPVQARIEDAAPGRSLIDSVVSPAIADTVGAEDRAFQQMFAQVGAFAQRDNAMRFVAQLKASGFANSFVVSDGNGEQTLHRVRLGPLSGDREFDRVTGELRALGLEAHLVVER